MDPHFTLIALSQWILLKKAECLFFILKYSANAMFTLFNCHFLSMFYQVRPF